MAKKKSPVVQVVYRDASGRFASGKTPKKPAAKKPAAKKPAAKKPAAKKPAAKKAGAKKAGVSRRDLNRADRYEALAKVAYASAKKAKSAGSRAVQSVRAGALNLKAKAYRGTLSKADRDLAKAHGLMRVNPSSLGRDLKALILPTLVAGVSAVAVHKAGCMVRESAGKSSSKFVQTYGSTLVAGGATIGAYLVARKVAPRHASAVLFGGIAATFVQALVDTKLEDGSSLGKKLYPQALQGYVSLASAPSAEAAGAPYSRAIAGVPSVESFASPSAMQILEKDKAGSLSGSIFG